MNRMNDDHDAPDAFLDDFLAAARADRPDTSRAEYGFETRLMARIAAPESAPGSWWIAWTWRLAPVFAIITLSLSVWTHLSPTAGSADDRMMTEWSASADDDLGAWVIDDFLSPS